MPAFQLPIIYHPAYLMYNFGAGHPFSPIRQEMLVSLLEALPFPLHWVAPVLAPDEALLAVHSSDYLDRVALGSVQAKVPAAAMYGLGTSDVPLFRGMDNASRWLAGGALKAAQMIVEEESQRVLQLGGGLHHAFPERASGFCVYNDLAVAIQYLRQNGLRVAYIDVDVHHGDGVQWIFYDDPNVLTISLHESGRYLFPGTGEVSERGAGKAIGTAINVPLMPYTEDASYLNAFEAIVPVALAQFQPDVLVIQAGADAHFKDPLAHLMLTTRGFESIYWLLLEYADAYAGGRALFTLGGGYDLDATVRTWTILTYILQEHLLPQTLPESWQTQWKSVFEGRPPLQLHDLDHTYPSVSEREEIEAMNRTTVAQIKGQMRAT